MAERRPSWRGHLKLSLVTCPVALYNAISPAGDVHFHLINPKTGHRIKTVTIDATTSRPIERKDLVKGFEVTKGKYVTLTAEEIDAVKLESTKTIDIDSFVPCDEIDRIYWDHPYFLVPDGKLAAEPFAVIRETLKRTGQAAIGRVVISERERLVALEPRDDIIVATTLRSHDEVHEYKTLTKPLRGRASGDMIAIASKIVKQKAASFNPQKFEDRYEDALRDLIKRKRKGQKLVEAEKTDEPSNVVDLMDALKKKHRSPRWKKENHAEARGGPSSKNGAKAREALN